MVMRPSLDLDQQAMGKIDFATYVAQRRTALGKTQKNLAVALSYTPQAISKFETYNSAFPLGLMGALCLFLDVSLDNIVHRDTEGCAFDGEVIDIKKLGKHLSAARNKKGLSQADIASKCGLSVRAISNYEKGKAIPSFQTFEIWCDACEMTPSQINKDPGPETIVVTKVKRKPIFIALPIVIVLAAGAATPAIVYAARKNAPQPSPNENNSSFETPKNSSEDLSSYAESEIASFESTVESSEISEIDSTPPTDSSATLSDQSVEIPELSSESISEEQNSKPISEQPVISEEISEQPVISEEISEQPVISEEISEIASSEANPLSYEAMPEWVDTSNNCFLVRNTEAGSVDYGEIQFELVDKANEYDFSQLPESAFTFNNSGGVMRTARLDSSPHVWKSISGGSNGALQYWSALVGDAFYPVVACAFGYNTVKADVSFSDADYYASIDYGECLANGGATINVDRQVGASFEFDAIGYFHNSVVVGRDINGIKEDIHLPVTPEGFSLNGKKTPSSLINRMNASTFHFEDLENGRFRWVLDEIGEEDTIFVTAHVSTVQITDLFSGSWEFYFAPITVNLL